MERIRAIRFDIARDILTRDAGELAPEDVTTFGFLQQLVRASEFLFVVPVVVELLARRDHSRSELARKLRRKGFSAATCDQAVHYVQERGYQSDRRFAESWIRGMMRGAGRSQAYLEAGLVGRGVAREVITDALDEYEQENPGCFTEALAEQAERVLRQVASVADTPDYFDLTQHQQKTVVSRLMRRGFSMKEIQRHFA